eukprot:3550907-Pleurochrysis_carterae.AAC.1
MLEDELRAGGVRCPKQCASAANNLVRLSQFARVLRGYVGQAHDVIAIANGRRPAVCCVRAREETRN